jgi:hypothetical protein
MHAKRGHLSAHHKSVAIAVYVLSGHCSQSAAEYCCMQKAAMPDVEQWRELVEGWYLSCSIDRLVAIQSPDNPGDVRISRLARKWLSERGTAHWVRDQNFGPGVAPSSSAIIDKFSELAGPDAAGTLPSVARTGRRFCQNLRKAWHIRLGTLRVRDDMPEHVIRNKAPEFYLCLF